MADTYTTPDDVAAVWRPLRPDEATRAEALIGSVERLLVGRWPSIPKWIDADRLDEDTLSDVVVWLVLPALGTDAQLPVNAKSWQVTGGTESQQVTLADTGSGAFFTVLPWMVDIFERLAREDDPTRTRHAGAPMFGGGRAPRVGGMFPSPTRW